MSGRAEVDRAGASEGVRFAAPALVGASGAGAGYRAALVRAKARLDRLDYYPRPVRIERVRVVPAPWLFRLPHVRRYSAYALWRTILVRREDVSDDLLTHELCHVWQGQNRPLHVTLVHLTTRYRSNPYELEARRAVAETRDAREAEAERRPFRGSPEPTV